MTDLNRKGDILKVRLGDDVRRMVLYNTHISYDDLVLMLQRVYDGKLKSSDDVALKYYDEDNDLITIADDSDFAHAREYAPRGVVKMVVYVNRQDRLVDTKQLLGIRKELSEVRDKVNSLVDALDSARVSGDYSSTTTAASDVAIQQSSREWAKKDEPKIPPQAASMFDPLATSSIQTSSVTTTLSTVTGTVSSTQVDTSSGVAGQSEAGASHLFASSQDGSSLFSQVPNLAQPLSQSQSGSYYSQPQAITSASAPPPSTSPQPPSSSTYPAAQTGQPSYPSQPQTGSHQPYPSSYAAQPSAPSVATAPVSNPSSYPPSSVPNPSQYPPTTAANPSGFAQGSYPQTMPGSSAPYPAAPGSYAGSNVGAYPSQGGSPYPPQPGAAPGRYPAQQYGRPYKIGY